MFATQFRRAKSFIYRNTKQVELPLPESEHLSRRKAQPPRRLLKKAVERELTVKNEEQTVEQPSRTILQRQKSASLDALPVRDVAANKRDKPVDVKSTSKLIAKRWSQQLEETNLERITEEQVNPDKYFKILLENEASIRGDTHPAKRDHRPHTIHSGTRNVINKQREETEIKGATKVIVGRVIKLGDNQKLAFENGRLVLVHENGRKDVLLEDAMITQTNFSDEKELTLTDTDELSLKICKIQFDTINNKNAANVELEKYS